MTRLEIDRSAPVTCRAETAVAAAPEEVWAALVGVAQWTEWNTEILAARLDGPLEAGSTIHWQAGGMDIQSRLVRVEPYRQLIWNGTHGAVHVWTLSAEDGKTTVTNEESISEGPALDTADAMTAQLQAFLERWNMLLKACAEAGPTA